MLPGHQQPEFDDGTRTNAFQQGGTGEQPIDGVTGKIAVGAGLIAVLSYRILLLVIAAVMAIAAAYLGSRREQRPSYQVAEKPPSTLTT